MEHVKELVAAKIINKQIETAEFNLPRVIELDWVLYNLREGKVELAKTCIVKPKFKKMVPSTQ
jgi:hypothetical protein